MPETPGRPVLRTVFIVVAVIVVVSLVVAAGAAVVLVRRPLPRYDGQVRLDGLRAEVEIVRDSRGIPQIYGTQARDLFRAQGYVHAQDRFFEMDYRRHVASGRLAELVGAGDGALEADAVIRSLGWRAVAEDEVRMLSPEAGTYLEAYAGGVNDYIGAREASELGLEYSALGLTMALPEIEPWTAVDSLLWLKALSWDLSRDYQPELERSALYDVLGDVGLIEQLFPAFPQDQHAPILGSLVGGVAAASAAGAVLAPDGVPAAAATATTAAAGATGTPVATAATGAATAESPTVVSANVLGGAFGRSALAAAEDALRAVPQLFGEGDGIGSNSWVVSGDLTATGSPILANDPHLAATVPGPWYQVGLHCREVTDGCPFDVAGFGFAGVPGVLIGHNADVAWGLTSLRADVTDVFLERVYEDGTYVRDGQRVALERRTEVIEVNGGDAVRLEVASTVHGPIVSDVLPALASARRAPVPDGSPGIGLRGYEAAIASASMTPGRTLDAIFALDAAREPAEVTQAAALFGAPAFGIVYATTGGDIGFEAAGQIPQRGRVSGAPVPSDGTWPRPGWDSNYDWLGFVAPQDLPRGANPASGYIVAANQAAQPVGEGPSLGAEWDAGYRSQRIADLIARAADEGTPLTVEVTEQIQGDVYNPVAALLVPYLLEVDVDDAFVAQGVDLLRDWDLEQSADSPAAAYFASVWSNLLRLTFWDDVPEGFEPDGGSRWFEVVNGLLGDPQSVWWDDRSTINIVESRDEVLIQALTSARIQLTVSLGKDPSRWAWSKLHDVALQHPVLGGDRFPEPVNALANPRPLAVGGGSSHVRATAWDARVWRGDHPVFDVSSAPSMRMVVDLADLDASTWVTMTGVSGHPASTHYTDQLAAWAEGRSYPWSFTEDAVRGDVQDTRLLLPRD